MTALGQRIGNKNIMNRGQSMFKIKILLPQIKQVEVKKNSQVVRRMTVEENPIIFFRNRWQFSF